MQKIDSNLSWHEYSLEALRNGEFEAFKKEFESYLGITNDAIKRAVIGHCRALAAREGRFDLQVEDGRKV